MGTWTKRGKQFVDAPVDKNRGIAAVGAAVVGAVAVASMKPRAGFAFAFPIPCYQYPCCGHSPPVARARKLFGCQWDVFFFLLFGKLRF